MQRDYHAGTLSRSHSGRSSQMSLSARNLASSDTNGAPSGREMPSAGPFQITNAGHDYYVNDDSQSGDFFTSVIGDNAASGKSPAEPMLSLTALLAAYGLLGCKASVSTNAGSSAPKEP